jgi:hypothetical protein
MGGEICALTLRLEELLQELMSPLYMCSWGSIYILLNPPQVRREVLD